VIIPLKIMQKKIILIILCLSFFFPALAQRQKNNKKDILQVLAQQVIHWNNGDIEKFMESYWKSDSLMFIGKSGLKYGWQTTLENYKKGYPDKSAMGQLDFDIINVNKLSGDTYFVVGKWHLSREIGNINGHFSLIWKKLKGQWVIVADHSS
jgi:ketosteroid isomerase-like protein